MSNLLLLLLGLAAALLFVVLLVRQLRRRAGWGIWALAGALLVSSVCFSWLGIRLISSTYQKSKQIVASAGRHLAPRTGPEIYAALFGPPAAECVAVLNHQDQVVPRLDCCIWLEFNTCPVEIRRILARDSAYHAVPYAAGTVAAYSPRPVWWAPAKQGNSLLASHKQKPGDPNHDQWLVFTPDSTHAYYCDMAD